MRLKLGLTTALPLIKDGETAERPGRRLACRRDGFGTALAAGRLAWHESGAWAALRACRLAENAQAMVAESDQDASGKRQ